MHCGFTTPTTSPVKAIFPPVWDNSWKRSEDMYFWGSSLPKDWSGCPTQLQNLRYESNIEPVDENDIEDIKKQIGSLTNIPYDLTFELNNPNKIGYNFVGGILINPKWKPDVKREIRSYIGYCLKSQYKNIMGLKKRICNSEKSI